MDKSHNGWGNYETWRVSLEFFDSYLTELSADGLTETEARQAMEPDSLKSYVEDLLEAEAAVGWDGGGSTVLSYALAFIEDVDWREIHAHMADEMYQYDWDE